MGIALHCRALSSSERLPQHDSSPPIRKAKGAAPPSHLPEPLVQVAPGSAHDLTALPLGQEGCGAEAHIRLFWIWEEKWGHPGRRQGGLGA